MDSRTDTCAKRSRDQLLGLINIRATAVEYTIDSLYRCNIRIMLLGLVGQDFTCP